MSIHNILKKYPLISIGIDQFPDNPGKFSMSYGYDNSELKNSISQVGIINHPFIYRNDDGTVEVVTGFRRILALKDLDINEVECYDLTDSGMSLYDMLKFALHDNLFTREFNLVEKSRILNNLTLLVKENNLINEFICLLNVSKKDYDLVLQINSMDKLIKKSVSDGSVHIKTLEHLVYFTKDNQLIINSWINNIKLNHNQQIQFIDYILDISRIEKIPIEKLLNERYYNDLLADKKKNTPQKAKELIDNLRERRNPNYTKYRHFFEKKIRKLQLPKNIKIKYPRYFESEGYHVEIDFRNGDELKRSLNKLLEQNGLEDIGDPWNND